MGRTSDHPEDPIWIQIPQPQKTQFLSSEICLITVADRCSFSDKYYHNDGNICNAPARFFLSQ